MYFQKILFSLLFLITSFHSFAWGTTGHRVVGGLAQRYLDPTAEKKVRKILNGYSLADVSNWMDEIKSEKNKSYRSLHGWHYMDLADVNAWEPRQYFPDSEIWPKNLYESLLFITTKLKHPQPDDSFTQSVYLRMLVHLVADAHQPLHVGNGEDLGGNRCYVKWFNSRWPTTLHAVWDTKLIDFTKYSYSEYVDYLDHIAESTSKSWQQDGIETWLKESRRLHALIYPSSPAADASKYCGRDRKSILDKDIPSLSFAYIYHMRPIMELRLQQAGVRLAGILNTIYG